MSRSAPISLDLACVSFDGTRLVVLLREGTASGASELPWAAIDSTTDLAVDLVAAADRLARASLGTAAAWCSQLGAYGDGDDHPAGAPLSVTFIAIAPAGTPPATGHRWVDADSRLPVEARQRRMVTDAIGELRDRMDVEPVAFLLLPSRFTLAHLQSVYELLLGRRLPKASFRRALRGAALLVPLEEWTSQGRGRPAQLFRYAPRKGKRRKRPVRFEMLR